MPNIDSDIQEFAAATRGLLHPKPNAVACGVFSPPVRVAREPAFAPTALRSGKPVGGVSDSAAGRQLFNLDACFTMVAPLDIDEVLA